MENNRNGTEESWLADQWIGKFGEILGSMAGQPAELSWVSASEAPSLAGETLPEGALLWREEFTLGEGAALWIYAAPASWQDLGTRTLMAAGIDSPDPEDLRNTYLELLDQSFSAIAQTLASRLQRQVTSGEGAQHSAISSGVSWLTVDVRFSGEPGIQLSLGITAELVRAIENPAVPAPPPEPQEEDIPRQAAYAEATIGGVPRSKTFDVLLDVALPVSVSFGRTQIPIKDVLKLTTGSIVELNRSVTEPVEVIVNNCIIARGEVVVVEGNYGVRIHQIVSKDERLRQTTDSLHSLRPPRNAANLALPESAQ